MRTIIILIALAISINIAYSQSFTEAFDSVFQNISRADATTGILYNRSIPFAQLYNFNSSTSFVDTSNNKHFIRAYWELYNAAFQPSAKLSFDVDSLKTLLESSENTVDVGILHYKFNTFDSATAYQKLYFDIDSVLYEDTTISASLYLEQIAFIASPLKESIEMETIFRFRDVLRFDNTGNSIVELWVDFDDGLGLQQITDSLITVIYSISGIKTLRFEAILYNGVRLIAYSVIDCMSQIYRAGTPNTPHSGWNYIDSYSIWSKITPYNPYDGGIFAISSGDIRIYYADSNKKLHKPVLIVDGFDPGNERQFEYHEKGDQSIWQLLSFGNKNLGDSLLKLGYDLVILDLPDGGGYIEHNAMVCIEVINGINKRLQENCSDHKIVIVGPSMGGQITRYALAYMEKILNVEHNCNLWVSFDSPHQGANISLGAQAFLFF